MIKLETQFKRSKGGYVHFSFLSIHFGNGSFGITILGVVLYIDIKPKQR